jgi:hypothetical protein
MTLVMLSCSGSEEDGSGSCPDGSTSQRSGESGPSAETRDEAVRAWLEREGLEATDDAISAGVIAAEPGAEAGKEVVAIEQSSGAETTLILEPLDPGWAVASATWCEPA